MLQNAASVQKQEFAFMCQLDSSLDCQKGFNSGVPAQMSACSANNALAS